jgi:hypothetical protein
MSPASIRIAPLAPEEFTEEQKALVGPWSILNFSRVLIRHPKLYQVFVPYIEKVISFTELPSYDREVLVIRVLARSDEIYEAMHHVDIAHKVGMSDAHIEAIKSGGKKLSELDRHLINAADELIQERRLSDATWQALAQHYSIVQMMEIVGLVGCYTTMAMLTKTFGIQPESTQNTAQQLATLRNYT